MKDPEGVAGDSSGVDGFSLEVALWNGKPGVEFPDIAEEMRALPAELVDGNKSRN